ncbi:MAG TPA: cysteine desulfurase family protein [Flavisolibacter sp.]|nr:cysteine desulfurase family protein [Flavisolibacter sp.]
MIYLDNNSTTKVDQRVVEAILPYYTQEFANPASNHSFGIEVNNSVKEARGFIATLIGCNTNEIIFTSGATEAINMALKGIAKGSSIKGKHIITVKTEHPAVIEVCENLLNDGFEITFLNVTKSGLIDLDELKSSLRSDTIIVCVMMVNNETGVIQPISKIASIAHEAGALFMSDATQAVGKVPIDVEKDGIDILAFSGHKLYGPKGVGALYIRSKRPRKVNIPALIHGGGHERGLRSGTLNTPGIIGLGKACKIASEEMDMNAKKIKQLRDCLEGELLKLDQTFINGDIDSRLFNVSNICFKGVDADALIIDLEDIIVSTGSACSSMKVEPSHVLKAMGLSDEEAYSSIRFSLCKFNTQEEIQTVIDKVKSSVPKLRLLTA